MNINKPTLLVDKSIALANIKEMKHKADNNNVILRPHFKTHQSAKVGEWFRYVGVDKITVSSIEMAFYFAKHGWKDITIAFPLNIRELDRIIELSEEIELTVLISSVEHMEAILATNISKLYYFIKIDVGYHRSGLEPNQFELIKEIIAKQNEKLRFKGFLSHFGNTYQAKNKEDVISIYKSGVNDLLALKEKIDPKNEILISIGDTSGCSLVNSFVGVDEIRPGNFVYYDLMQKLIGSCTHSQVAAVVACPVVDIYPQRNEVLIYGGAVHLSKEYMVDNENNRIYGEIVEINKNGWGEVISNTSIKSLSQEHGIIATTDEFISKIRIGDIIGVVPVHSCLAANLLRDIVVINGKFFDKEFIIN